MTQEELKYLKLLGNFFPNIDSTCTEIINLQAILKLPKGTEHFLSDLHGEYEAFNHVLKNCSGAIKEKINILFSDSLTQADRDQLATVIYYPQEKIDELSDCGLIDDEWYKLTIKRILPILQIVASKYSSSKVRKALPQEFQYIIQEILYEKSGNDSRKEYIKGIIDSVVEIGQGKNFITALGNLIQRLAIDKLHIVGDIYDRGPSPDKIMDRLSSYHNWDIQWGNHDILWMGAGAGQLGSIANVVRICMRYGNNNTLEESYGINLLPLATLALGTYNEDICSEFIPKIGNGVTEKNISLISKMHKCISIIQFKIEGEIIRRNPLFQMEDRNLLHKINLTEGTIEIDGNNYPLKDQYFPTIDPDKPYLLTEDEKEVIEGLKRSFLASEKLQNHIELLYSQGSIYKKCNGNLLYHGSIPMDQKGEFCSIDLFGKKLKGKDLLDRFDQTAREAYLTENIASKDILWYLWCGPLSPLFGKNSMKTFERYFLSSKKFHSEDKNQYYNFFTQIDYAKKILREFNLDENSGIIINGHVPVKVKKGESPVKADGKVIIIDGGFSSDYRKETGIAGYTLVYNSKSLKIVSHDPFDGVEIAIKNCRDIISTNEIILAKGNRTTVKDSDVGIDLSNQINDLKKLLTCYRKGIIKESWKL
ncbi:MAG: fructose-1,6-bisphosphatase [Fusobacteriaceae bacterium]